MMKKKNNFFAFLKKAWAAIKRYCKRAFFGGGTQLEKELQGEEIVCPTKQIVKKFASNKLAVASLVLLIGMFAFVFVGPLFYPIDLGYADSSQANIGVGYSMMRIPRALKNNVKDIAIGSRFSIGLDKSGKVYFIGQKNIAGVDLKKIPKEVKKNKVVCVAAGVDHALAITEDGQLYGWGASSTGQYYDPTAALQPDPFLCRICPQEVLDGVDASQVKKLVCGNQTSALLMQDGTLYAWGNQALGATNMGKFVKENSGKLSDIAFTSSAIIGLLKDGTFVSTGAPAFGKIIIDSNTTQDASEYFKDKQIKGIAATQKAVAVLHDENKISLLGSTAEFVNVPIMREGEQILSLAGGGKHFTLLTNKGRVVSWGDNALGQSSAPTKTVKADGLIVGANQNYAITRQGKIVEQWGLKGYLMGTDGLGRDIFSRIVNGGKMTMTVGAIAVVISSVIGVFVGCMAGYFGGRVDILLMRITEIFTAVPFLPFAVILSSIVHVLGLSENMRIFLIMVILGLLTWPGLARLVRGQVLAEREKEFVLAAKAMGVKESKIAFKHILPNVISVIIVSITLDFAGCLLTESSLSYLGFGVSLPRPTWGNMLNGANNIVIIRDYWWQWVFPALFLGLTTICINVIGDTLRDVMDPKSSSET